MKINKIYQIIALSTLLAFSTVLPARFDFGKIINTKTQILQSSLVVAAGMMDWYAGGALVVGPALNFMYGTASVVIPTLAVGALANLAYQANMLPNVAQKALGAIISPISAIATQGFGLVTNFFLNDASKATLSAGGQAVGGAFTTVAQTSLNTIAAEITKAGPTIVSGITKSMADGAESWRLWAIENVNLHNGGQLVKGVGNGIGNILDSMIDNWQKSDGASGLMKSVNKAAKKVVKGAASQATQSVNNFFQPTSWSDRARQLRKAAFYGMLFAAVPTVGILMKQGATTLLDIIKYRYTREKINILLPGTKYGTWDRFKLWLEGYKIPSMIFDSEVKDRLLEIEEKTRNIRDHIRNGSAKSVYRNLLLYGDPGTGKTFFARILADRVGMDFVATTAGALLQSGVEGIKYWDGLMELARLSKYGLIIFIDEADALFVNRDDLKPESDHYKVLNHILSLTGSDTGNKDDMSKKCMIIAATNHAYLLDEAMGRRFKDHVRMPLPNAETRKELIYLYATKELLNEKDNGKQFVEVVRTLLTKGQVEKIIQQTEGLSHAEIKDMIQEIYAKADATRDHMIRLEHIDRAVKEAVDKCKAKKAFRDQRDARIKAQAGAMAAAAA